jgi:hypothetical protein
MGHLRHHLLRHAKQEDRQDGVRLGSADNDFRVSFFPFDLFDLQDGCCGSRPFVFREWTQLLITAARNFIAARK